jgi:glycosyltransferase involved in cell wall biosynthesis
MGYRVAQEGMTSAPTVTVVIPTRNRCDLLKETIASVFAQTYAQWELIVVDDASEDATASWLNSLTDSRVQVIRFDQRSERTRARNAGLQEAKGPYILFLDDDDLLFAHALRAHVDALEASPAAVMSIGGYVMFDEYGSRRTYRMARRRRLANVFQDLLFGWIPVSGQCLLRTAVIQSVNGWDGTLIPIEDHGLWMRIAREPPVVLLPDLVLMYRIHRGQWRPGNLAHMMTVVREQAVSRIEGRERAPAEQVLKARALANEANGHYRRAEAGRALRLYYQAIRLRPSLLRSPITRPTIAVPMMKCLVGNVGLRLGRPLYHRMLRMLKKEIKVTGNLSVDMSEETRGVKR